MKAKQLMGGVIAITGMVVTIPAWGGPDGAPSKRQQNAQAILDSLNKERVSMHTEDGQLDPQEVEHVQRMLRIYELKSGIADARPQSTENTLGVNSDNHSGQLTQNHSDELQGLQNEVSALRQEVQDLQDANRTLQNNQNSINEAAGAERNWRMEKNGFRRRY